MHHQNYRFFVEIINILSKLSTFQKTIIDFLLGA